MEAPPMVAPSVARGATEGSPLMQGGTPVLMLAPHAKTGRQVR